MNEKKCPACGEHCFFLSEPRYEGFTRVGEVERCTGCGHEITVDNPSPEDGTYEENEPRKLPDIFSEEDRPEEVRFVGQEEAVEMCRHCEHYLVNAFTQRCGLHMREVQATDTCSEFSRKSEPGDA